MKTIQKLLQQQKIHMDCDRLLSLMKDCCVKIEYNIAPEENLELYNSYENEYFDLLSDITAPVVKAGIKNGYFTEVECPTLDRYIA